VCVISLTELTEYKPGTSTADRICQCNSQESYGPIDESKIFGQHSKDECFISRTSISNQTGLCLNFHQKVFLLHVHVCVKTGYLPTTLVVLVEQSVHFFL